MAHLFTYGTLQHCEIQKAVFDRELTGNSDRLYGYTLSHEKIYGRYPVIEETVNDQVGLKGMVYQISEEDLMKVDAYEGPMYKRIQVKLKSGIKAWVFIGSGPSYDY